MTSYCDTFSRIPRESAEEVLSKREMSRDKSAGLMTPSHSQREGFFFG